MSDDTPKTVDELLDTLDLTDDEKAARQRIADKYARQQQQIRLDALIASMHLERKQSDELFALANAVLDRLIAARKSDGAPVAPPLPTPDLFAGMYTQRLQQIRDAIGNAVDAAWNYTEIRLYLDALLTMADAEIAARGNGSENAAPPWELVVPTNMKWLVSMTKGESEGGGDE